MAGQLTIDTLKAGSGVLATQNGMTGIAKAWVNFNGTGTVAINSSFNVSSITDNGTGNYTVNFTTAMANANYALSGSMESGSAPNVVCIYAVGGSGSTPALKTTTQCQILTSASGAADSSSASVIFLAS
jgi:hypothetical protein